MIKLSDFVDITENKLDGKYNLNNLIYICKRKNNNKRPYLFVDRFQGKHIPEKPYKIYDFYETFYDEIYHSLNHISYKNEKGKTCYAIEDKILIVGFAETATALAEYVASMLRLEGNLVYYLQTSREEIPDCPKLFSFDEEHSHAVNQYLYCKDKLPEFNRVLFVEDEITTGKTILNFIQKFKEINPNCKYSVASILNWQNEENKKKFVEEGIDRIYLIGGKLKDKIPSLDDVKEGYITSYYNAPKYDTEVIDLRNTICKDYNFCNMREGVPSTYFGNYTMSIMDKVYKTIRDCFTKNDKVMVIGTEEFMFLPFMMAYSLEDYCKDVTYRATTRSPITISRDTAIVDGITFPSAYDKYRQTYLYNLFTTDYDIILVVTDANMTDEFKNAMSSFAVSNHKRIVFVVL